MNDQELLEYAAAAVGIDGYYVEDKSPIIPDYKRSGIAGRYINGTDILWNPLENNNDAFLLMIDLGISVESNSKILVNTLVFEDGRYERKYSTGVQTYRVVENYIAEAHEEYNELGVPYATRKAIVRVAADIGKNIGKIKNTE